MDNFFTLLLGILFTALSYMAVPLLGLMLNCGRYEKTKAKKIALWNSIIVGFIYLFLTSALTDKVWKASPAFLYYWINCSILTRKPIPTGGTMSNTKKAQSAIQHSFAAPTTQEPITNPKPAPTQEEVIRELQKQVKMQELSRLSQMYNEKLCRLKRNNKIRWIITFCGFALVYFGVLVVVFPDSEVGLVGLLAVIFTAIHFLINASIFGWLIKKRKSDEKQLEPIIKKVQELEKSLNK